MSFPHATITDILATTMEHRTGALADNVTKNNAAYVMMKETGGFKTFGGGRVIWEPFSFAANGNAGWYSGYDTLPVAAQDVISGAEFAIKQLAVPVVVSGLERLQNSGEEALIDLLESRITVAESTAMNYLCDGFYSDGTGNGSKELTGLDSAVPQDNTTGSYGGISRVDWTFWRSQLLDTSVSSASTCLSAMNTLFSSCGRGKDKPNLILQGSTIWNYYLASLQGIQQLTNSKLGDAGFQNVSYMGVPVVQDGGIGGYATATDCYMLNTKYLRLRAHKDCNMKVLKERGAFNQDASVVHLLWAGNLTCGGAQFQGRGKWD